PASHLYVQMHLGSSPNPRTTEKRRFVFCNESSLSFCLLSDMLTKVSVIFSFEKTSPVARYFQKKVILKPCGFSDILFAHKLAKQISLGVSRITLRSNQTRRRRIEL
ncbi:MAG: hypothetical protein IJP35_04835, partial [Clostridia bacterium]|nr:hypothetical protein [Clostridia bacterium]